VAAFQPPHTSPSSCLLLSKFYPPVQGCGGGASSGPPPPPPAPSISVTVSPTTATVLLGNSQTLVATVSNTTDTNVSWSVNGVGGGTTSAGTITASGTYIAPPDLPSSAVVQVTATSQADSTKSATAQLTITSDLAITLAPPNANVELGSTQAFHASLTSNGHPDTALEPQRSHMPGRLRKCRPQRQLHRPGRAACSCDSHHNSTERRRPLEASLSSRQHLQQFHFASDCPAKRACGGLSNDCRDDGAASRLESQHGTDVVAFWARLQLHNMRNADCRDDARRRRERSRGYGHVHCAKHSTQPRQRHGDGNAASRSNEKSASHHAVQTGVNVSLSPTTDTLAANHRVTLTAQVIGTTNTGVNWRVSGVPGGSTALGQICVVGSSPCQSVSKGTALQVDYLAPGAIPQPNPVSVLAMSAADITKTASSQITVINHVSATEPQPARMIQ
jgi:hypothetical protein